MGLSSNAKVGTTACGQHTAASLVHSAHCTGDFAATVVCGALIEQYESEISRSRRSSSTSSSCSSEHAANWERLRMPASHDELVFTPEYSPVVPVLPRSVSLLSLELAGVSSAPQLNLNASPQDSSTTATFRPLWAAQSAEC